MCVDVKYICSVLLKKNVYHHHHIHLRHHVTHTFLFCWLYLIARLLLQLPGRRSLLNSLSLLQPITQMIFFLTQLHFEREFLNVVVVMLNTIIIIIILIINICVITWLRCSSALTSTRVYCMWLFDMLKIIAKSYPAVLNKKKTYWIM